MAFALPPDGLRIGFDAGGVYRSDTRALWGTACSRVSVAVAPETDVPTTGLAVENPPPLVGHVLDMPTLKALPGGRERSSSGWS